MKHRHCPRQWLVRHLWPHRGKPGLRQHQRSRRQQPGQEQPLCAQLLDHIAGEAGGVAWASNHGVSLEQPKILTHSDWFGGRWVCLKIGCPKFNLGNMMMNHQFLGYPISDRPIWWWTFWPYFLARWKYAQQHRYLNFTCKHGDQDQDLWHTIFGGMNINLYTSYYNRDGYQQ